MAGTRSTPSTKPKPSPVTVEHEANGPIVLSTVVDGKRVVLVEIPANIANHLLASG